MINTIVKGDLLMAFNPTVEEEKCVGCEECVDVCPVEVFEMQDGKSVPVNAEECLGCESCVEVCSEGAITVEET
jgi:NAD-dependent dihydropyrimidine dehydrogenase PreA subunit